MTKTTYKYYKFQHNSSFYSIFVKASFENTHKNQLAALNFKKLLLPLHALKNEGESCRGSISIY